MAQTKITQGVIIDKTTREPVPYVHIYLTRTKTGTMSDVQGNFSIPVRHQAHDTLRFSCIGYKTQFVPLARFISTKGIIELEEDRVLLPSITVYELTAKEYIQKCVQKIATNYTQAKKRAFYWNFTRHEDVYTAFAETFVTLQRPRPTYDSVVVHFSNPVKPIPLLDSLQDILSFNIIDRRSMFINPDNMNDWTFAYLYSAEYPQETFVVIEAKPHQNAAGDMNEFSTLKIFINTEAHAIVRVDFSYTWTNPKQHAWERDVFFGLSRLEGTVQYEKASTQKYHLGYLSLETDFSFTKRYKPAVFKTAACFHELVVIMGSIANHEKPVIRWNEYLAAQESIRSAEVSPQD